MAEVVLHELVKTYPGGTARATDEVSLEVADGEFMVLLGPSGCGKTTLLRMVAGLETPDAGQIVIGGRDVTYLEPRRRNLSMVFQSYAVFPNKKVADNIGFGLRVHGVPADEVRKKVEWAAELLQLTPYLDRYPAKLSGGQRQRVAVARAIVMDADVLLMDEPLSNLDAKLRVETRANIAALQKRLGTTTIYVTHDQVEAMTMGHRVAVLKDGKLQQCDTPRNLYERPRNAFVAGFIGSPAMNLKTVALTPDGAQLDGLTVPLPRATLAAARSAGVESVTLGLRPESLRLAGAGEQAAKLTVELVEELGADAYIHGGVKIGDRVERFVVRADGRRPPQLGETVQIAVGDAEEVHAFHPETGERLPSAD